MVRGGGGDMASIVLGLIFTVGGIVGCGSCECKVIVFHFKRNERKKSSPVPRYFTIVVNGKTLPSFVCQPLFRL